MFAFPGAELSVALNIIHCLVYFPRPQTAELVHVQMDWSVIWPGVLSKPQSTPGWVAEGPGLLEERHCVPAMVGEAPPCTQAYKKSM